MNVIISNKNDNLLVNLNVEILKKINGEFSVDEIINLFSNMFYTKMFLDITAIKNYNDLNELQKLAINMDTKRIVLLLDNNEFCNNNIFKAKLVNMGFYNFCITLDELIYLSQNTNTYRDVAHYQNSSTFVAPEIAENITGSKIGNCFVLGFKNVTTHAGSTSLIYMLKQLLLNFYSVVAIEVNRRDFIYFNDKDMISIRDNQIEETLNKYSDKDIILLDLNDCNYEHSCNDILYLIEPSIIKLNKMITINRNIFNKLYNKKIILNKCLLNEKDIKDFERESKSEVFYTIEPLNDRLNNSEVLLPLLDKMNFISAKKEEKDEGKKLSLFKF